MIHFCIKMDPVAKGRPRVTRTGHAFTPDKTRKAEKKIKEYAESLGIKPLDGPLDMTIVFGVKKPKSNKNPYPIGRPDVDNLGKLVQDSLNGIAYHDDSQVVLLLVSKAWSDEGTVEVWIEQTDEV